LSSIAEKFKSDIEDIVASPLNELGGGSNLLPGNRIVVPGGVKPFVPRVVEAQTGRAPATGRGYGGPAPGFATSGSFGWPTRGFISQGYWWGHRGLDIANGIGVPVAASDGGYVTYAGWSPVGYGYMVQIDHGNGFSSLYAHLSQWYIDPGQAVARGQIIGAMGSTGNSTGPHLHFELRYGGVPQNPLVYLP
jgi:murein DD-endopeptidase MepM/ murein hydrolase activator NlpD